MTCGRIALFSAPCGFGKTVASRALLPGTEQWAKTAYGRIGVKVWIYKGEVLNRNRAKKA